MSEGRLGQENHPRNKAIPKDWQLRVFSDITKPRRDAVRVGKDDVYREIGIRSHGKGIFHKESLLGESLGNKRVFWVHPDCLIFNIVFAWEGAVAITSNNEAGMIASHRFPMFQALPGVSHADYLRRFFQSPLGTQLLSEASPGGAGRNRTLNQTMLAATPIPLPPLPEQRKIAAILSAVDAVIERTQAVIDQLQQVKKALMQELLTRGIPGRHTRYKPLLTEWRLGRMRQNLSEIPFDWELVTLTDIAKLESGHTPSRREPSYWDGDIPWVSLQDTKGLDVPEIHDTKDTIGQLGLENSSARLLPKGTVIFSRTATVGKSTILGREMTTSQDFANYVCGERIHNRYLMHVLRNMQDEWKRLMAGSTHQTIYMPIFRDLQVLVPLFEEQEKIAAIADAIDVQIAREVRSVDNLKKVKSALMSVLLSGEVRVKVKEGAA